MTSKYFCVFKFEPTNIRTSVSADDKSVFTGGFWVTRDRRLSQSTDTDEYWIPPSAILYIRKVKEAEPAPAKKAVRRDALRVDVT